jgi:hypothetical protein
MPADMTMLEKIKTTGSQFHWICSELAGVELILSRDSWHPEA